MATNNQITELVDVALKLKEHIENKDIEKIAKAFEPNAKINIYGRFYNLKELIANLARLLKEIEQPGLDIISVDESEIKAGEAFAAFTLEIFWINQKTWDEISQVAALSLQLLKDPRKNGEWKISGFTLARNQKVIEKAEVPLFPEDNGKSSGAGGASFLDGIFNFWY